MTNPFIGVLSKFRGLFGGKQTAQPEETSVAPPPASKRSGEKLSKTVLPSTKRAAATGDPFHIVAASAAPFMASTAQRKASTVPPSRARELPPALAMALEPKLQRAISLQLSDFLDQIPAEYIKPVEVIDTSRAVSLKASEIEKGMPERNPSISLSSLYHQVPEIFLRDVEPTDPTRVALPFERVLEQFANLRVREDQVRDENIPQVETPILQATIEDTHRFGTRVEPVETSSNPPLPVQTATAEALASAEPEPVATELVSAKAPSASHKVISLHSPEFESKKPLPKSKPETPAESPRRVLSLQSAESKVSAPPKPEAPELKLTSTEPKPQSITPPIPSPNRTGIPFEFPPNGTGAPASERVPASCGPPVPNLSSSPPESKRIPLKLSDDDAQSSPGLVTPSAVAEVSEEPQVTVLDLDETGVSEETAFAPKPPGPTISLALKPLLQNVPAFQLNGDPQTVANDLRVELPMDLVAPQLATGRVVVPPKTFFEALPVEQRSLFSVDPAETPVSLPLQEVLMNLPQGALKLREDQVKVFVQPEIETPISAKAKEDAKRFKATAQPAEAEAKIEAQPKVETGAQPKAEAIDAKQVIAKASELEGIAACELMFPDGLSLAGNFPAEAGADGLCAMAPSLLQRVDGHTRDTKLGGLAALTAHCGQQSVTFLLKQNVCLAALHKNPTALTPETRSRLDELLDKLSRTFVHPTKADVDH
jgi:hypothetical protein